MIQKQNIVISDELLNFLAESYLKIKNHPTYKNFSTKFQQFVDEYLERELRNIHKNKNPL